MKKLLLSLIASAGFASGLFAGEVKPISFVGRKTFDYAEYSVDVSTRKDDKNERLEIVLRNNRDRAKITDNYPIGFGDKGDRIDGTHVFNGGEILEFELYCLGNEAYGVESRLVRNGDCLSHSKFRAWNVPGISHLLSFIASVKIGPIRKWGDFVYNNLLDSIPYGVEPKHLPYDFVKREFDEVEREIPRIRDKHRKRGERKLTVGDVLFKRIDYFNAEARRRLKL